MPKVLLFLEHIKILIVRHFRQQEIRNHQSLGNKPDVHSRILKIAPQEGKKVQSRNFADKKKNMWYADDPSLVTMRKIVQPVVALQFRREHHINQR